MAHGAASESGGDPKASLTIVVSMVFVIVMLEIVIFGITLHHVVQQNEIETKVYARPYPEVTALYNEQREALQSYRWINQEQGVAGIPIGDAMELTVRALKSDSGRAIIDQNGGSSPEKTLEEAP